MNFPCRYTVNVGCRRLYLRAQLHVPGIPPVSHIIPHQPLRFQSPSGICFRPAWVARSGWSLVPNLSSHPAGTFVWQRLITTGDGNSPEGKGENLSFADAWYFTVVTFTTVGYGDILPKSQAAKGFFMFWCIASSFINFAVVSKFLSGVLVFKPSPEDNVDCEHCGRPQLVRATSSDYRRTAKYCSIWT